MKMEENSIGIGKSSARTPKSLMAGTAGLLVLLAVFMFLAVVPVIASAAQEVEVRVNAPEYVEEGATFNITIDLDNITDFNSAQFDLSFDSSAVNVAEVVDGRLDSATIPVSMWAFVGSETIRVLLTIPGAKGVSGSGYLAKISFEVVGKRGDRSVLDMSEGLLVNNKAEEIPAEWLDDEIRIGVEVEPTPTPTPTPTLTPTPTPTPTPIPTLTPTPTPSPSPTPAPTPSPTSMLTPTPTPIPTPDYDYVSETSVEGDGIFSIDKKVRNRAAAVNLDKHIRCNGSIEGLVTNAYLIEEARGNNPNFKQVDAVEGYRTTAPGHYLYGEERVKSSFVFGGTGARIHEIYKVQRMDARLESINLHSTGDQRYKTELETINDFSGYFLIDAKQSIPGVRHIEDRQEFLGNFTVRKHIIFREKPNRTIFDPGH